MSPRWQSFGWLLLFAALGSACSRTPAAPRSPEALRSAYLKTLEEDDPQSAYALLSPELRARENFESFQARWKENAAERRQHLDSARAKELENSPPLLRAQTLHPDGRRLSWERIGDRYLVSSGFSDLPDTRSAEATIRSLIAVLRETDHSKLDRILSAPLRDQLDTQWASRAEALESALERDGALRFDDERSHATLRYGNERFVTLEKGADGWRVTELR